MGRHCDGKCRITVSLQALAAGKAGDDVGCSRSNTKSFNDDKRNTEQQDQGLCFLQQQSFLLGLVQCKKNPCSAMDQFSQQGDN